MRGCRGAAAALATVVVALLVAGCGGGESQDANEPSGTFTMKVVGASFPSSQHLATPATMKIVVKNTDSQAIPDVAVTVDSFSTRSQQQDLADPSRAVWIIGSSPPRGTTAYVNTWALGRLPAGHTRTFAWTVTPVQAGTHTISYRVAAGLNGKAQARVNGKDDYKGSFTVSVSDKPVASRVDPKTGDVVRLGG